MKAALATVWLVARALNWGALMGLLLLFVGCEVQYSWPIACIAVGAALLMGEAISTIRGDA